MADLAQGLPGAGRLQVLSAHHRVEVECRVVVMLADHLQVLGDRCCPIRGLRDLVVGLVAHQAQDSQAEAMMDRGPMVYHRQGAQVEEVQAQDCQAEDQG